MKKQNENGRISEDRLNRANKRKKNNRSEEHTSELQSR